MTLSQVAILELSGLQDLRKIVKSDPVVKSGKLAEDKISSGGKHRGPCEALGSSLSFSRGNSNGTQTYQSHLKDSITGLCGQDLWFLKFRRCLGLFGAEKKIVCPKKAFKYRRCFRWLRTQEDIHRSRFQSLQSWDGNRTWRREWGEQGGPVSLDFILVTEIGWHA